MYNKDVFEKMEKKFGVETMPKVCEIIGYMFEVGHQETVENGTAGVQGFDHERDWWKGKYNELIYNKSGEI